MALLLARERKDWTWRLDSLIWRIGEYKNSVSPCSYISALGPVTRTSSESTQHGLRLRHNRIEQTWLWYRRSGREHLSIQCSSCPSYLLRTSLSRLLLPPSFLLFRSEPYNTRQLNTAKIMTENTDVHRSHKRARSPTASRGGRSEDKRLRMVSLPTLNRHLIKYLTYVSKSPSRTTSSPALSSVSRIKPSQSMSAEQPSTHPRMSLPHHQTGAVPDMLSRLEPDSPTSTVLLSIGIRSRTLH